MNKSRDSQISQRHRRKSLPSDFQEIIISLEMKLKKDTFNITLIKKLLCLYSVSLFLKKRCVPNTTIARIKQRYQHITLRKCHP